MTSEPTQDEQFTAELISASTTLTAGDVLILFTPSDTTPEHAEAMSRFLEGRLRGLLGVIVVAGVTGHIVADGSVVNG